MPQYLPAYDLYMSKTHGHHFNMFVMKKKELFATLLHLAVRHSFELEQELDMTGYTVNTAAVFGFVSERLLDAWLITNNISFEELGIVYMEHQNWLRKGHRLPQAQILPKR